MSTSALGRSDDIPRTILNLQTGRFLRRIHSSRTEVLEWSSKTNCLSVWPWCVLKKPLIVRLDANFKIYCRPLDLATGQRLAPATLHERAQGSPEWPKPYCLCSIKGIDIPSGLQSNCVRADAGIHAGEYVFVCSVKQCGYIGTCLRSRKNAGLKVVLNADPTVPLERIYKNGNFSSSFLPREGESYITTSFSPHLSNFLGRNKVIAVVSSGSGHARPSRLKRTYAISGS